MSRDADDCNAIIGPALGSRWRHNEKREDVYVVTGWRKTKMVNLEGAWSIRVGCECDGRPNDNDARAYLADDLEPEWVWCVDYQSEGSGALYGRTFKDFFENFTQETAI